MQPSERYDLIRIKIERAKEHFMYLRREIDAFFRSNPYVITTKRDAETRRPVYFLASTRNTPPSVAAITGDILQNLRSALDHLAFGLVAINGFVNVRTGTPLTQREMRIISFPITNTDSPAQYEANRVGKVKGMRQDAIDAIDATKPYKGGNDVLWRVSELNNVDKHRLLITVGAAYRSFDLTPVMMRLMNAIPNNPLPMLKPGDIPQVFWKPKDRLCPLKAGDELFTDLPDAEMHNDIQFRFEIALSEPQIIEAEPLLDTLVEFMDVVENLILSFKPLLI